MHPASNAAVSHGRILGRGDGGFGLLYGVDHRDDDAPSSGIERTLDIKVSSLRHAAQRDAAGIGDRAENCSRAAQSSG